MATASNPLEEFLSSEVDERALNALVGSLESQLASPTAKDSSQQISSNNSGKKLLNNDHIGGTAAAAVVLDRQKAVIPSSRVITGASNTNSVAFSGKRVSDNRILGVNSVVSSQGPAQNSINVVRGQLVNRLNSSSPVQPPQLTDLTNVPVAGRPNSVAGQPLLNSNGTLGNNSRPASAGPVQNSKSYVTLDSLRKDSPVQAVIKQDSKPQVVLSPRHTGAITVQKSQPPIIVRTPISSAQQIQIMSTTAPRAAGSNSQLKTLAPRIVSTGNPIRIGVPNQQPAIAPRPGTTVSICQKKFLSCLESIFLIL